MNSMEYVKWNASLFVENLKTMGLAVLTTVKGIFMILWYAMTTLCAIGATAICLVIALMEHGMVEVEEKKRQIRERKRSGGAA